MVNELKVAITADSSSAMASLSQFSGVVKATSAQIEGSFGGMANAVQNFAAPLMKITALLGGGAIFKGSVDQAVTLGKEVNSLQRLFGGTAEQASVTRIAIKEVFGDVDGYESAATKLVKTLNKNESAIKSMGVQTRDSQGHFRDMTELMPEVVAALGQYKSGTDRDAAAQAIFGRSFADVLKYVNMTPAAMDRARQHAHDFGLELDDQEKDTIKKYRSSVQLVSEAWEGLGVQVGVAVMPQLTSLANMLSSNAPAAINATVGALRVAQGLLSNTAVQIGLGALALNAAIPLVVTLATKIPLVSAATGLWRVQMALAAKEGVTGMAAVTGAARGTASGLLGMINPWVAVGVVAVAAGYGIERWMTASSRAARAELEHVQALGREIPQYQELSSRLEELDSRMKSGKLSADEKRKVEAEEKTIIDQMCSVYPDFIRFLYDENGKRRDIADAIRFENKHRIEEAERVLNEAKAHQINTRALIEEQRARANIARRGPGGPGGAGVAQSATIGYTEAALADSEKALATQELAVQEAAKNLQKLQQSENDKPGKHWGGLGDGKSRETISQAELDIRLQKARIEAMSEATLVEQQAKAEAKANLDLEEQRVRLNKEVAEKKLPLKAAQEEYDALKAVNGQKLSNIQTEYNDKRTALEDKLQGQLTAAEEGGLAKRLEAIRKSFVQIRADNKIMGVDGVSEDALKRAQDALEAQAKIDQTKADLEALKKELSELAQISGGKLSAQATNEVLARYRKGGKGAAADKYSQENHLGEGANAGIMAGLNEKLAEQEQPWTRWKNITLQNVNAVQSSLSNLFVSMTKGGSVIDKLKDFFVGLGETAVKSLADIAAQNVVNWGIQKAMSAWQSVDTQKKVLESTEETGANTADAASGIFKAHAGIPFAGVAIAIGLIALMLATMGSVKAHANGGVIDRPTLALMGEIPGSTEIVANERDFKSWANQVQNSGYNLGANIGRQQAQASSLYALASSYGSSAVSAAGIRGVGAASANSAPIHYHNDTIIQGNVLASSLRDQQQIASINQRAAITRSSRSKYRINANERTMA